ncbi:TOTE conflict system archaeo-eukaryotic primase domain-containing protein [Paenibacillus aestuarii]|uniref:Helix-turn-helix domain-containing protein n=1 Tax=Paenibacillus aestuarii TaxID=516965 RepID=A0ABW0K2U0_9BACL|nr:helix-turn-helix domain-containing protein [Paenibacillus aestuarii]
MQKVIDKLFDYYLIQNTHYLIQMKDGTFITRNDRSKPLRRFHVQNHLGGKLPIGTFSGAYLTKFICFDVDYADEAETARWVTYKLADTLDDLGLHNYAISFSGSKGYHVELFYDKAISVAASRQFFDFIVQRAEIVGVGQGKTEFVPYATRGVKLPLGIQQKTGNFCGFCNVDDGLRVMDRSESIAYFLTLKKTDHAAILELIHEESSYDSRAAADMENAISRHKPLAIYDQSESYTLAHAAKRYNDGMTAPGQRHKSFLLLARLMNHNGVERPDALAAITEWFTWQDRRLYSTEWSACIKDLQECVDYVYHHNQTLITDQRDLTVTFSEIDAIIRRCPQKNQKAVAYAMLVHSKRWGNGIFYMSYGQIEEAAGVDDNTVGRQINKLEKLGVIAIVSRNQKQKGTYKKRPNFYRMTLSVEKAADERSYEINGGSDIGDCLRYFYTEKEIRSLLPRRQSNAVLTVS